ncbi:MAG: 2-amino-4-hydroxy-6-hydroxymethyldihydropteridine diphosphokinase [Caulobacter sp.]|nr:2-amino-4-hydroxy-6-hydroxymethyldihydropteridine diphosphokinase [Caulobacter sp.]
MIVALGSNLPGDHGDSRTLLEAALDRFSAHGLEVAARSGWWRSAAWPDPAGPAYTNGVAVVETALTAEAAHRALQTIEQAFGRNRGAPNAPRTLDLDLIAFGRLRLDTADLILPHPRAHQRLFVMGPLAEVAPDWIHPRLGQSAAELARRCDVGMDAVPW